MNGQSVSITKWVDWNRFVDEVPYAQWFRAQLVGAGFRPEIGMLVDTSRNGWGGAARPVAPGPRTTVEAYVEAGRIDRRFSIANWCNQVGAGLGERPAAAPEPGIDAYVWVKPPGESDGTSDEPLCDPAYNPPRGSSYYSGALPGAPPAGDWFPAHLQQLVGNAWPPL